MSSSSDLVDRPTAAAAFGTAALRRSRVVPAPPDLDMPMLPELVQRGREAQIAVERRRAEAYEEGKAAGHAAGQQRAAAEAAAGLARLAELGSSLAASVADLRRREVAVVDDMAIELTRAALLLAEAVIGRELASVPPAAIALERARSIAPSGVVGSVHVHPDDAWSVAAIAEHDELEVVADDAVSPGNALLVVGESTFDGSLDAAFARVRSVLLGEEPT
jgi:flagellar biosynthesis/type III secretory pathway protein FliH